MTLCGGRAWLLRVLCGAMLTATPAVAQTPEIGVRTGVDRTALWVGDRVTYTITITCKRGVDVLVDDVSRDKLRLEGLEVVDSSNDRRAGAGGTTIYEFRYVLTTYRVDTPALKIAPLRIRYAVKRAGQRLEDAAPAGDIEAAGATLAFRSVLPEDPDTAAIRSDKAPHVRPARFAALQPIGIGLVVVSVVPAIIAAAALVRRARRPRVRRSARSVRHEERASLEAVRTIGVETVESRREAFTRLDALVRDHLRDRCGVRAVGLTPQEVPFALAATRAKVPAELVAAVLETCELARYAPPYAMPSADACRTAIDRVTQILSA